MSFIELEGEVIEIEDEFDSNYQPKIRRTFPNRKCKCLDISERVGLQLPGFRDVGVQCDLIRVRKYTCHPRDYEKVKFRESNTGIRYISYKRSSNRYQVTFPCKLGKSNKRMTKTFKDLEEGKEALNRG